MSTATLPTRATTLKRPPKRVNWGLILTYVLVILVTITMLAPFVWMLSASLKLNRDVFAFPIEWIPSHPRWQNYIDIWTKIPLALFIYNTFKLTMIVTILQLLTSSFAAYAFAKLRFPYRNALFLAYIATIAMPWQVYMVPQFIMMRGFGLNNTLTCADLPASVHRLRRVPDAPILHVDPGRAVRGRAHRRHERIRHLAADHAAPLPAGDLHPDDLHLREHVERFPRAADLSDQDRSQDIQIGIRIFITQYTQEYGLIMAASVVSLIPVLVVFLALQRFFVEGIASTGLKG